MEQRETPRRAQGPAGCEKTRVHSGKQAVQFTVPTGKDVGAGLVKWFQSRLRQLYARWYCFFAALKPTASGWTTWWSRPPTSAR